MSDDNDPGRIKIQIGPVKLGNDPKAGSSSPEMLQRASWFGALFGGIALAVAVVVALFFVRKHEDMALPAFLGVVIVAAIIKMLRSGWLNKK
jgi:hypothetical protein